MTPIVKLCRKYSCASRPYPGVSVPPVVLHLWDGHCRGHSGPLPEHPSRPKPHKGIGRYTLTFGSQQVLFLTPFINYSDTLWFRVGGQWGLRQWRKRHLPRRRDYYVQWWPSLNFSERHENVRFNTCTGYGPCRYRSWVGESWVSTALRSGVEIRPGGRLQHVWRWDTRRTSGPQRRPRERDDTTYTLETGGVWGFGGHYRGLHTRPVVSDKPYNNPKKWRS